MKFFLFLSLLPRLFVRVLCSVLILCVALTQRFFSYFFLSPLWCNAILESIEEDQTLLEDTAIVQQVSNDYNVIEFSSEIPVDLVEMLPYGELRSIIIESQKTPNILVSKGKNDSKNKIFTI